MLVQWQDRANAAMCMAVVGRLARMPIVPGPSAACGPGTALGALQIAGSAGTIGFVAADRAVAERNRPRTVSSVRAQAKAVAAEAWSAAKPALDAELHRGADAQRAGSAGDGRAANMAGEEATLVPADQAGQGETASDVARRGAEHPTK
jgi:hypothetical protein